MNESFESLNINELFKIEEKTIEPINVSKNNFFEITRPKHWHQIEAFASSACATSALTVFDISDEERPKLLYGSSPSRLTIDMCLNTRPNPTVISSSAGIHENVFIKSRLLLFYNNYMMIFSSYGLETFSDTVVEHLSNQITTALKGASI